MESVTEQDRRAMTVGYRAMLDVAIAALLRIENECSNMAETTDAAREALDELGEPK